MKRYINLIYTVVFAVIFVIIAFLTLNGKTDGFNLFISEKIQSNEYTALTVFLKFITNCGEWFVLVIISVFLAVLPKTRYAAGIPVLCTLFCSTAAFKILKHCFQIPRPDAHRLIEVSGYGFPSGHSVSATSFAGILVMSLIFYSDRKKTKIFTGISAFLFVSLIGYSRIYLGVHSPCDVFGGISLGIAFSLCGSIVFFRKKQFEN